MTTRWRSWAERGLSRLGIDPHQYEHLLRASLTMDFRRPPAHAEGGSTQSALATMCVVYGIFSALLAVFSFRTLSSFSYSYLLLAYSMLMVALVMFVEFGTTIISPEDYEILGPRPISSRTYFAVKLSNLFFYIALLGASLNLLPAFLGAFSEGSRGIFPLVYFPVALGACLFSAMLVILFYGAVLRLVPYERFKDILVYIQIVLSFLTFFGYQLVLHLLPDLEQSSNLWIRRRMMIIPPGWFAGMVQVGLGYGERDDLIWGGWGLLVTGVLVGAGMRSFSLDYSSHLARVRATASATSRRRASGKRRIVRPMERLFLRTSEERAAFCFVRQMLRRNRTLKMRLYPALSFPVAILALGVMDRELSDPFLSGKKFSSAAFFVTLIGPLLVQTFWSLLPYSEEHAGAWVFRGAPLRDLVGFFAGVKKAFLVSLLVPLFLILGVILSFFWIPTHAFLHAAFGLALSYLYLGVISLFSRGGFPFSREPIKGVQSGQVMLGFLLMPLFAALLFVQYMLYRHPVSLGGSLLGLFVIGWILNRAGNIKAARATEWREEMREAPAFREALSGERE